MTDIIVKKADQLAHAVYHITQKFPREELFGITSQLRRASLSIVLNLVEGFARSSKKEYLHFIEIAYGSLKETKYLIYFCSSEKYINREKYDELITLSDEIGKLIWNKMLRLRRGK